MPLFCACVCVRGCHVHACVCVATCGCVCVYACIQSTWFQQLVEIKTDEQLQRKASERRDNQPSIIVIIFRQGERTLGKIAQSGSQDMGSAWRREDSLDTLRNPDS